MMYIILVNAHIIQHMRLSFRYIYARLFVYNALIMQNTVISLINALHPAIGCVRTFIICVFPSIRHAVASFKNNGCVVLEGCVI